MGVVDRVPADPHPRRDTEYFPEAHRAGLERRRRRHDLVDRSGLEHVGDGAVADRVPLGGLEVVGVEPRIGGHRVDIAGPRVHDDDRAALGTVLLHRSLQGLLRQVLDLAVQRGHERASPGRRLHDLRPARDRQPVRRQLHRAGSGRTGQDVLVLELEARESRGIDPDEAEHLRRERAGRE